MRICIITKYIPPASTDGIPRNRWDYAREFTALGHEVHIITSGRSISERVESGVYIHEVHPTETQQAENLFGSLSVPDVVRNQLFYSYLVYLRIRKLNEVDPIHLIESPLWDIEGYITRLRLPHIPFALRLETTSMLLKEILTGKTPKKDLLNEIETHFLQIVSGYVFDSWSILKETERLYKVGLENKPYAVIHHGIDLSGGVNQPVRENVPSKRYRLLSVGRLEKRKGTDILVKEILPALLERDPDIEIHLVGKDSGEWDGFLQETGLTYHGYIRKHFKSHVDRRIFLYGYVKDEKLEELYSQADLVLALSRYESFGLLYLEAMRKGKPLIVFNTGAVPEIFDDGQDAIILSPDQPKKVVESVLALKADPAYGFRLAENALKKLTGHYSAERMARECSQFFNELAFRSHQRRVFQVMNCLTDRDGVSNTTIGYEDLLKGMGEASRILGTSATPPVRHLIGAIESVPFREQDLVIYHYWNYCERGAFFNRLTYPKKVFFFHNMTTPSFFTQEDEAFRATSRGFAQLGTLDNFDVYVGHTHYSLEILRQSISKPIQTHIIPPWIDQELILRRPHHEALQQKITEQGLFQILFVGSIAPHKKQTDLIRFFHYYSRKVNPDSHLTIVGGGAPKYLAELEALVKDLNLGQQVTITGKVGDEELYAYYRAADVYVSMSEHEGFGVPLAEAMVFNLPVIAYRCTAIPDTVGENGALFDRKDHELVSSILQRLRMDRTWKEEVLARQKTHLLRFSRNSIIEAFSRLFALVDERHLERLNSIKSQPDYQVEEYIYHNDERLAKSHPPQYADGQFIIMQASPVQLTDEFSDVECSFLSHDWSGKVKIRVDDLPVREIDLFSSGRKIRIISLNLKLSPGKHTLAIWPTGERSSFSKGNEVLLHWIKLLKPLTGFGGESDLKEPLAGADGQAGEEIVSTNDEILPGNINIAGPGKVVRLAGEVQALESLFNYEGEWAVRDKDYKFSNGESPDHAITFEKEFVYLDMKFIVHAWCGMMEVTVDGLYKEIIDLYRPDHAHISIRLKKKFGQKIHRVVLRPLFKKNRSANGYEIFFGGIGFEQHMPIDVTEEALAAGYRVSVIINTLDRADHLEKLLEELEKQTYGHFEIVAVNGPSKDRTMEILNRYQDRLKIAHCPEANLSQSRNIGIENAGGNYVAFIDDDALPRDKYWLENFVHFIIWQGLPNTGAVGGPVRHKDTDHYEFKNGATSDYGFQIFREEELKSHELNGKRWVQGVAGGNNMIAKEALYVIGGFDERYVYYLDETDMCIRLARKGYSIVNNPINYIRHFKAPSKVRKSSYDIRWDIIARSDMYYALKNGYDIMPIRIVKAISYFRKKHFYREVVKAYKDGTISLEEYKKYRQLLKKGFFEGLKWGIFNRAAGSYLKRAGSSFRQFRQPELLPQAQLVSG